MTPPLLPNPIATLLLEDLRQAALYLDELGAATEYARAHAATARRHATRLWSAAQAVERLMVAVEQLIVQERSRRAYEGES